MKRRLAGEKIKENTVGERNIRCPKKFQESVLEHFVVRTNSEGT
jgi:hypothetical protein